MEKTKSKKTVWQILSTVMLCIAIFLLILLTAFNIFFYKSPIVGISMQPTFNNDLQEGLTTAAYEKSKIKDKAYVYRFGKGKRGDVIMVEITEDGKKKLLIKRLVAVGGDTVDIKQDAEDGFYYLYINGKKQKEDYIKLRERMSICFESLRAYKTLSGIAEDQPLTLEPNEVFVLGDNRGMSNDSSSFGPVKKSSIKGVVAFVVGYKDNLITHFWKKIF